MDAETTTPIAPIVEGPVALVAYRPARQEIASREYDSFYARDGHWLSKRRDGRSPSWQIVRPANGTIVYKSTGTDDFEKACKALDAFVEQAPEVSTRQKVRASTTVYFIEAETGLIKIGASHNPDQRIKELRAMSPVKLTILATVSGRIGDERAYHKQFAAHRSHGEWFHPHPDILAEITRLARSAQ